MTGVQSGSCGQGFNRGQIMLGLELDKEPRFHFKGDRELWRAVSKAAM